MEVPQLIDALNSGHSLVDLLTALGTDCLDNRDSIRWDRYSALSDTYAATLAAIETESQLMWGPNGAFLRPASPGALDAIAQLSYLPGLAGTAVLEGICRGAGRAHFLWLSDVIRVPRGMVLPLPVRHLRGWNATPNPATTHYDLLDPACGFVIWEDDWTVELDFTYRERLEEVCWREVGADKVGALHALPRIASVHPFSDADMATPDEKTNGTFFGVHPRFRDPGDPEVDSPGSTDELACKRSKEDNAMEVVDALALVGLDAEIAVVPEFTLHEPTALEIYWDGVELPPIIVAGSAHCEGQARSNTSILYLDGIRLLEVSKYQPFVYRERSNARDSTGSPDPHNGAPPVPPGPQVFTEAISPQPRVVRVAASTSTRLVVAICSDLNSTELVGALTSAGVNVLLCPAWTPKEGTFPGALQNLASFSQCVSLVANTPGHPAATKEPFWALTMVPREAARPTLRQPPGPGYRAGVMDPNILPERDDEHFRWI